MGEPQNDPPAIRVLVLDDHLIVGGGLRRLLDGHPGLLVSGAASRRADAIAAIARDGIDVVVFDLDLLGDAGLALIGDLRAAGTALKVLVISGARDWDVHLRALRQGAMGVVTKDEAATALVKAIARVAAGEAWVGRLLMGRMLATMTGAHGVSGGGAREDEPIAAPGKAPVGSRARDDIASLEHLAALMLTELKEVTIDAEVVRLVLARTGVTSDAEYDTLRADVMKAFDHTLNERIRGHSRPRSKNCGKPTARQGGRANPVLATTHLPIARASPVGGWWPSSSRPARERCACAGCGCPRDPRSWMPPLREIHGRCACRRHSSVSLFGIAIWIHPLTQVLGMFPQDPTESEQRGEHGAKTPRRMARDLRPLGQ